MKASKARTEVKLMSDADVSRKSTDALWGGRNIRHQILGCWRVVAELGRVTFQMSALEWRGMAGASNLPMEREFVQREGPSSTFLLPVPFETMIWTA